MSEHEDLVDAHVIHKWTYADAAARTGAGGFVSADRGKVAKQTDTNSWWVLTATTPTWAELTGTVASASTAFLDLTDVDPATYVGQAGQLVAVNSAPDALEFITPSTADVVGPAGATDEAIARYDTTTGKLLQDSTPTINNTGDLNMLDGQLIRPELLDYGLTRDVQATASGATTIDLENGNVHEITMIADISLSLSNPPASGISGGFTLILKQDAGGANDVTAWFTGVVWPNASAPTVSPGSNAIDIYSFFTVDAGTTVYGFVVGQAMG